MSFGPLAAHATFTQHFVWCQVMGQQSPPSDTCLSGAPPDAPSGTYQVGGYVNFTTEGDTDAGHFEIVLE